MTSNLIGTPINIHAIVAQSLAKAAWRAGGGTSLNVPGLAVSLYELLACRTHPGAWRQTDAQAASVQRKRLGLFSFLGWAQGEVWGQVLPFALLPLSPSLAAALTAIV